jgi:CDP-diglyceride synthetase
MARSWPPRITTSAIAGVIAAGCDPIVNIQGSFFPSWTVCMAVGGVLTAGLRQLFAVLRLEPHLGPLPLVYPSLWVLMTMLTWLAFYRT